MGPGVGAPGESTSGGGGVAVLAMVRRDTEMYAVRLYHWSLVLGFKRQMPTFPVEPLMTLLGRPLTSVAELGPPICATFFKLKPSRKVMVKTLFNGVPFRSLAGSATRTEPPTPPMLEKPLSA